MAQLRFRTRQSGCGVHASSSYPLLLPGGRLVEKVPGSWTSEPGLRGELEELFIYIHLRIVFVSWTAISKYHKLDCLK